MTISEEYGVSPTRIRFNHKLGNKKNHLPACFCRQSFLYSERVAHDNQLGMCLFVWRAHFVREGRKRSNHDLTERGVWFELNYRLETRGNFHSSWVWVRAAGKARLVLIGLEGEISP